MTITYKRPFSDRSTRVPILHKVYYGEPVVEADPFLGIPFKLYPLHDAAAIEWCQENCRAAWYQSSGYVDQCFVEFEDDEDAMMFSLRWSK
jgi:hypothetical protein